MSAGTNAEKILEANRVFHDEVEAPVYDSRMGIRHEPHDVERAIAELEDVLGEPLPSGVDAIDLGAGTGNLAVKLAIDGRFRSVTAVDISPRMLEVAAASAKRHGCEIKTIVSDMTRLPFDDQSVDLVVGCAILHHVPTPAAFISEIHRVLKPGGRMVIIGEPSAIGVKLETIVKLPAILAVRTYRFITGRQIKVWEHDLIDVHTFNISDIKQMSEPFSRTNFRCEGFLEPMIDQGFMVIARRVFKFVPGIETISKSILRGMDMLDKGIFNRVLPQSALSVIKFAGWK